MTENNVASFDKYNVKYYGAIGDGIIDDTVAIQTAINAEENIIFPPGDYCFSSQLTINKPITIGGMFSNPGGRWNYDNAHQTITRLLWTGDNITDSIFIGGTVEGPFSGRLEAVCLHNFVLMPKTKNNGHHGILVDGSQTLNPERRGMKDLVLDNVAVRHFGSHQVHLLGNVFDARIINYGGIGQSNLIYCENAISKGSDNPSQIYLYNPRMTSRTGKWCIIGKGITVFGGCFAGKGNGFNMLANCSIFGAEMEGTNRELGSIGVLVKTGCQVFPRNVTSYDTGIMIGEGNSDQAIGSVIAPGVIANNNLGLHITSGGSRKSTFLDTRFSNNEEDVFDERYEINGSDDFRVLSSSVMVDKSGSTSNRPSNPRRGQRYFDTTIQKPIWFNGSAWVNSMGEEEIIVTEDDTIIPSSMIFLPMVAKLYSNNKNETMSRRGFLRKALLSIFAIFKR